MALREEFERSGSWLFRWRSYLPLLLFGPVLIGLWGSTYPRDNHGLDTLWAMRCLAIALVGLGVRVATVDHVPAGTSGRNTCEGQVAAVLNTTGMYSVVRHPLYVGNYLMWLDVAMLPRVPWVVVVVSLAFWLYYERIMFAEEEFLRRKFGAVFETWAMRTPAFLPVPSRWRSSALRFSLRTALRRENSGLFGLISAFAFAEVSENAIAAGRLVVDPLWATAFGLGALSYCTLRFLKCRTEVLRIPGR